MTVGAVVINLHLNIVAVSRGSFPAGQDVTAGEESVPVQNLQIGGRVGLTGNTFPGYFVVCVSLHREGVAVVLFPIHSETCLNIPPVVEIAAVGVKFRAPGESHAIYAVVEILAISAA